MKNFVKVKWLMENINDENLIILDATAGLMDPLEGINSYNEGHIKGAYFVSLEDVSTGEITKHGGRHPLPDLNIFIEEMEKLGVNNSSKIVIYDDGTIAMAGRLWWLFKLIGKRDVYILEGGKNSYIDNGGEITTKAPVKKSVGNLSLKLNEEIMVGMEYVKKNIDNENVAIVDVRNYERYIGKIEPLDTIAGHIKNTLNYPWTELLEDWNEIDLVKVEEKLKDLREYEEILVHCGSGITGTVATLLLDEIGIDSKLYPGGYSDWISYEDNEVVQGGN